MSNILASGQLPLTTKIPESRQVITALVGNSEYAFISSDSGSVYKLATATGEISTLANVDHVWSLVYRGNNLVFGSLSGEIHSLSIDSPSSLKTIKAHASGIRCLAFLNENTVASGSKDSTVRLWTLQDGALEVSATLTGHSKEVRCLAAHGDVIVSGSSDHDVRVWDTVTGQCLQVLSGHTGNVQSIRFDGQRIVTSSADGQVRVWDPATGGCLIAIGDASQKSFWLRPIHLAGNNLVVGRENGLIERYDLTKSPPTHKAVKAEPGPPLTHLDVSASWLVYNDETKDVKLLDIETGQVVHSLDAKGDDRSIYNLKFLGERTVVVYTTGYSTYATVF